MELELRNCVNPTCTCTFKVLPNSKQKYCSRLCESDNIQKGRDEDHKDKRIRLGYIVKKTGKFHKKK